MTDFPRNGEIPPEPIDPTPSAPPEPYNTPSDTPMTAHQYEDADPSAHNEPAAGDTPMTAPDIAAGYSGDAEGDTDTSAPEDASSGTATSEAGERPYGGPPLTVVEQQERLREEEVRTGVLSLAQWLGPKLAELGIPPDAAELIGPRPETARPLSEAEAALAEEFKRGWVLSVSGEPWNAPPFDPEDRWTHGDRWGGAVSLPPSGELVGADGIYFEDSTAYRPLGDAPDFTKLDVGELTQRDDDVKLEGYSDHLSITAFNSASVARALVACMERYGLVRGVRRLEEDIE